MDLVEEIYSVTKNFPKDELYGLSSQIKRCAISVPSNIAEGSSKKSTKEFIRFLNISYGSLSEIETQILIAQRLKFLSDECAKGILENIHEIGRMMNGLRNSLKNKLNSEHRTLETENA